MRKELIQKIEIPSGVEAEIEKGKVTIKGKNGENSRKFELGKVSIEKKENSIIISCKKSTKREKKKINTITAHIKNMIKGVTEKFTYKLKICFAHFPITVEIKGNGALIKNFLGEKVSRKCLIPKGVEVKVEKDTIIITSHNKELAGQGAANFEKSTRIRARDRRIFQDGIYLISKGGKDV